MKKITVNSISFEKLRKLILKNFFKKKTIFNFCNSNDFYHFKTNKLYLEKYSRKQNFNLIDGFMVSLYLGEKRLRGPEFTQRFFEDKELLKNKKHFFIGFEKKDLNLLVKKKPILNKKNLWSYNPPYIKDIVFSKKEIQKIMKLVNKRKVDYLWIGIGAPKQTIMANQIYDKVNSKFIFNVGAAFDFVTEKKKEAPRFIQKIGLEWLFRLITDFKYPKKKIYQSLLGTFYMIGNIRKRVF